MSYHAGTTRINSVAAMGEGAGQKLIHPIFKIYIKKSGDVKLAILYRRNFTYLQKI